jgi:hypothetical protein
MITRDTATPTTVTINGKSYTGTVYFNMCNGVEVKPECAGLFTSSAAYMIPDDKSPCINLISQQFSDNSYELIDPTKKDQGFKIHKKDNSDFNASFICNDKATDPIVTLVGNNISLQSSDSCGIVNEPAKIFFTHKNIFCSIMIAFGIVLLLVGGSKWNVIVGAFGFFIGAGTIFFIFWAFVTFSPETNSYIIISVVAVVVGILMAYVCHSFIDVSYAALGFTAGYFISRYLSLIFQLTLDQVS